MPKILIDASSWPVVVVTPPAGLVTDAELDEHMLEFRELIEARKQVHAVVIDLRVSSGLTPTQRKRLAKAMEESEQSKYCNCAGGLIFSSTIMRGMLTAILWLKQPRHETRIFATRDEAVSWGQAQVRTYLQANATATR